MRRFLAGAAALLGVASLTGAAAAGEIALKAAGTATAVEFYNPGLQHYFASSLRPDIDALDTGHFPGWYRTGQSFDVFPDPAATGLATSPVCRFYIPPEHGDSHFLSASPAECAAILQLSSTNPDYSGYVLESSNVFYVAVPDAKTGSCPGASVPLYRLWNGRADSNHRYTTDPVTKAAMVAQGYIAEGYGPDAVAMCVAPKAITAAVASGLTPIAGSCDPGPFTGTLYPNSEVEPRVEADPTHPNRIVAVWQQDRWSDGGARGLVTGVSNDGGRTWTRSGAAFTRCTGGTTVGAEFDRASDPWVTFAPDGTVYQIAIAFNGPDFGNGANDAVLVSSSHDGGLTWSAPTALLRDARTAFNDKESITADPTDARFVYATWDRLLSSGGGPTWFARTTDGGATWEPARNIYDPGQSAQTLNNQIVVLPDGTLLDFFTLFTPDATGHLFTSLAIIRSPDRGVTWSQPTIVAASLAVGASDPQSGAAVRDAADIGSISVGRDGRLAVAWQDSRFSGGLRDGIAFVQSFDGGLSWTVPLRINAVPTTQAFVPTVKIRDDGVIGVTYYDFRNDALDAPSLGTDYWLTESTDGVNWRETHVSGPFDLATAPNARGYFLGDYQGLTAIGSQFVPVFAQATGSGGNRTDILAGFASVGVLAAKAAAQGAADTAANVRATLAPVVSLTEQWRDRLDAAARVTLARRARPGMPSGPAANAP